MPWLFIMPEDKSFKSILNPYLGREAEQHVYEVDALIYGVVKPSQERYSTALDSGLSTLLRSQLSWRALQRNPKFTLLLLESPSQRR
tara:strand:- start:2609 stop:2869 length:261 start_codon:yes stop_codon:yes gene_type:complete